MTTLNTNLCFLINIRHLPEFSVMPLGILAVGGSLLEEGFDVKLYDGADQEEFTSSVIDDLRSLKPAVVGLSVMTHSLRIALDLTRKIKEASPQTMIAWGGVHSTLYPEQVVAQEEIDMAVVGEGHETMLEVCQKISSGENWSSTPGICYRHDGDIVTNHREAPATYTIKPFPYHLIEIEKYATNLLNPFFLNKTVRRIDVISSIGCPFKCRFCINVANKRTFRPRSIVEFVDELERLMKQYNINVFKIMDEYFFCSMDRIKQFLDLKKERGLVFYWDASVRADVFRIKLDNAFVKRLHDEGCLELGIGAESGSQRVLDLINKKIKVSDILLANKMCRDVGICVANSFMTGIPGETLEERLMTKDLIMQLIEDYPNARIIGPQIYRPYPGAPLTDDAATYGFQLPDTMQGWIDLLEGILFGNICDPREMPWINDSETTYRMLKYLHQYIIRRHISEEAGVIERTLQRLIYWWLRVRLKNNFYSFPFELMLSKMVSKLRSS